MIINTTRGFAVSHVTNNVVYICISDGSVVSFQKAAVAIVASVVLFLKTVVAVVLKIVIQQKIGGNLKYIYMYQKNLRITN